MKKLKKLNVIMLGHKRIPSREGGIEVVVEELSTRMVALGYDVVCYNRAGHHVSGKEFDDGTRELNIRELNSRLYQQSIERGLRQ